MLSIGLIRRWRKLGKMSRFLDLPLEIRNLIYAFSLVTTEVIRPFLLPFEAEEGLRASHNLKNELAMGLLSVNHQIREEARAVFYGRNLWYLSARCTYCEQPDWSLQEYSSLWNANIQLFRHIVVSFDSRDAHQQTFLQSQSVKPRITTTMTCRCW